MIYNVTPEEVCQMRLEEAQEEDAELRARAAGGADKEMKLKKHNFKWAMNKVGKTVKEARKVVPKKYRKDLKKKYVDYNRTYHQYRNF